MPNPNGPEFVRAVRSPETFPLPDVQIIMLTGYGERSCVAEALNLGVNDFLLKPGVDERHVRFRRKRFMTGWLQSPYSRGRPCSSAIITARSRASLPTIPSKTSTSRRRSPARS